MSPVLVLDFPFDIFVVVRASHHHRDKQGPRHSILLSWGGGARYLEVNACIVYVHIQIHDDGDDAVVQQCDDTMTR